MALEGSPVGMTVITGTAGMSIGCRLTIVQYTRATPGGDVAVKGGGRASVARLSVGARAFRRALGGPIGDARHARHLRRRRGGRQRDALRGAEPRVGAHRLGQRRRGGYA